MAAQTHFYTALGWTKKIWQEQDLNLHSRLMCWSSTSPSYLALMLAVPLISPWGGGGAVSEPIQPVTAVQKGIRPKICSTKNYLKFTQLHLLWVIPLLLLYSLYHKLGGDPWLHGSYGFNCLMASDCLTGTLEQSYWQNRPSTLRLASSVGRAPAR